MRWLRSQHRSFAKAFAEVRRHLVLPSLKGLEDAVAGWAPAAKCWCTARIALAANPISLFHLPSQIYPHGSTDSLPYATMGSGSLNAMSMFEAYYKDDMTRWGCMQSSGWGQLQLDKSQG